jgi:hypothetical protein
MTLENFKRYIDAMLDNGWNKDHPVFFRNKEGEFESIDYAVSSNDGTKILFAEEWM